MNLIDQVKKSQLSKQGKTSTTGIFEGVPANVAAVTRTRTYPTSTYRTPVAPSPIDATFDAKPQLTYLDYMRAVNKL